jgi:heme/copper-type cytochrome/quinol oxidase subunit 4
MASVLPVAGIAVLVGFAGSVIYTMVAVGQATADNDNKNALATTILNVTIVDVVLFSILGVMAYFYFNADSAGYDIYVMCVIHISLFLSLLSASISAIQQLS